MMPHELAHQWYGDQVSWASYHEQWLLEAIGELLLSAAAGAHAAGRCSAHAGELSPDPGQPIARRPSPGRSWSGNARQPAFVLSLPQRLRDHHVWPRHLADPYAALDAARRLAHRQRILTVTTPSFLRCCVTWSRFQGQGNHQCRLRAGGRGGLAAIAAVRKSQVAGLVLRWLGQRNGVSAARTVGSEVRAQGNRNYRSGVIHQDSAPFDLVTSVPVYGARETGKSISAVSSPRVPTPASPYRSSGSEAVSARSLPHRAHSAVSSPAAAAATRLQERRAPLTGDAHHPEPGAMLR